MKVDNLKIYDLDESIIASGYPMRTETGMRKIDEKDYRRVYNLTKASNGNGAHGQWLTGVRVAFDLTCSNKMWVEAERYRFLEFVSSQSTMHRISKFNLEECCNEYVDKTIIDRCKELQNKYLETQNKEDYLKLLYSIPSGFELTARLTTNYRCLLNIWIQRHDHRLPEWREFCQFSLDNLPYFKNLVNEYLSKDVPSKEELIKENQELKKILVDTKYDNEKLKLSLKMLRNNLLHSENMLEDDLK